MATINDSHDGANAINEPSTVGENVNPEVKKRKTHRLKQRFQVVRKLGQGTYGKVQLAINNETGQEVAIKTIKKSKVESEQDLIRIRREIQIMSSIHHPHIIHIYEVFENKDKIVLVMQYASGGEVYDYVSYHKVLSDSDARRLFRQIATAIYYCHKNKICHRDLKLENILLDEKGNAKIGDFGLSNVFDEKHFLQTFCGSPLYASPEIVRGLPYFGPEVDCWSLGVLLYTLVYGAMPFDGSNFKKLVKQISESSYYEPPNKSAASDLIRKLLTPNPRDRATIIDICADEWVNQDFEHSLLQLAEDLSNLTPVRCDMLHALAPVSPTEPKKPELNEKNSEDTEEVKNATEDKLADSNKRTVDNTSFNASSAEVGEKRSSKKKTKRVESNESDAIKSSEATKLNENTIDDETETEKAPIESTVDERTLKNQKFEETTEIANESTTNNLNETNSVVPLNEIYLEKNDSKVNESDSASKVNSASSSTVSSPKRPGKLSIPKIWDSQDKINIASEETPKSEKKAPFIPVGLKVSEAKKVIERKCSVDSGRGSVKRRDSLAATSELGKDTKARELKKYATRSLSLNLVDARKTHKEPIKQTMIASDKVSSSNESIEKTKTESRQSPSKPSTPISEEDKSLAKQIIKKNIARAKLMEKQQISVSSDTETTPLVSIENSNISIIENTPKQFEERNNLPKAKPNDTVVAEPFNAAPITRSYKKVTFTKDGACITESGKFYTHEGKDGYTTRVEKKSMVTHIISDDPSGINIQRSDSQSSSGSTDIFDDIFDDHWTGDVFSNVKSLFNNIFESSSRRFNERKSLRSRAESLERSSNSLFAKKTNRKSFFTSEDDDSASNSIFDSPLFSKSIFSNSSIKSNFDRKIEELMGPRRETSKITYPLPRLGGSRFSRESSLHRDIERDPFESRFGSEERSNQSRQDSTRRRVEQWLHSDEGKDLETYGTIGPKNYRRYVRTMTSDDSGNNKSNVFQKVHMSSSEVGHVMKQKSNATVNENSIPRDNEIEVRFSLDNMDGVPVVTNKSDIKVNSDTTSEISAADSGIKIAETSSLLEQLRTLGYKNLVNRRLSESSSTEDIDTNESNSEINLKSSGASSKRDVCANYDHSVSETLVRIRRQESKERTPSVSVDRRRKDSDGTLNADMQDMVDFKSETVQERIHRKSYYSRFNEDASRSIRQRRRSITRFNEQSEFTSSSSSSNILNRVKGYESPVTLSSFPSFDLDRISNSASSSKMLSDMASDISSRFTRRSQQSSSRSDRSGEDEPDRVSKASRL